MDPTPLALEHRRIGRGSLVDGDVHTTWLATAEPLFAPPWSWYGATELVHAAELALARCVGDHADGGPSPWEQGPYVARIGEEGFADLVDFDAVEHLLATRPLRDPTLQLLRDGRPVAASSRSGDDRWLPGDGTAGAAPALTELGQGATLVLNDAQELWPALHDFCDLLAVALGDGVTADVHVSASGGSGVIDHVTVDDALVLQVAGTTRWAVEGWALDAEQNGDCEWDDLTGGPISLDEALAPGSCLVVPRGFTTSSVAGSGPALTVVLWVDGRTPGSAAARGLGERYWTGSGPAAGRSAVLASEAASVDSLVVRRPGAVVWAGAAEGRLALRTWGREISAPRWVDEWIARLLAGPPISAARLTTPDRVADALVLVRRLVREGIVSLVDPQR